MSIKALIPSTFGGFCFAGLAVALYGFTIQLKQSVSITIDQPSSSTYVSVPKKERKPEYVVVQIITKMFCLCEQVSVLPHPGKSYLGRAAYQSEQKRDHCSGRSRS